MPRSTELWKKYNVPVPRYTSYPTVPCWECTPTTGQWTASVKASLEKGHDAGISLYVHLPYCESLCTYCGCNKRITKNHLVELPYIRAVLKEWALYAPLIGPDTAIRDLHLGGGTPTFFSPENLALLMDGLTEGRPPTADAAFSFEAHPANTTKEHLEILYAKGFRRLSLGIQDFDPKIQKAIHRFQTPDQVHCVVNNARAIGYRSVNFDLIYGLPFQTPDSVQRSTKMALSMRPDRIAFYSYAHVPWKAKGQRKYDENDLPDDACKRRLYEIGRDLFLDAGYIDIGMDHFSLPGDALLKAAEDGKLYRNFMGYTEHQTPLLIGLGMSAISDSGGAFVQNEKHLEDYLARVRESDWPFFHGHLLDVQDHLLRKHITNLMCRYETHWKPGSPDEALCNASVDRLGTCIDDGLVEIGIQSVKVTERGKPFIRNIAVAFDDRLQRRRTDQPMFSKSI